LPTYHATIHRPPATPPIKAPRREPGGCRPPRHKTRRSSAARDYPRRAFSSAAKSVLASSIATVNGPTPPGTGVIRPATPRTAS
jgi:hypothetical protein